MASYATLDEAFGVSSFAHKKRATTAKPEEKLDKDAAGLVFNSPQRRTMAAMEQNKELIGNLEKTLPIATSDEERHTNFTPMRVSGYTNTQKYNQIEPFYSPMSTTPPMPKTQSFAYAPPSYEGFYDKSIERKLDKLLSRVPGNTAGYETPATHDMLLYIFTGVFALFVLDNFVTLGKKLR
jgi:hypothetical protein